MVVVWYKGVSECGETTLLVMATLLVCTPVIFKGCYSIISDCVPEISILGIRFPVFDVDIAFLHVDFQTVLIPLLLPASSTRRGIKQY